MKNTIIGISMSVGPLALILLGIYIQPIENVLNFVLPIAAILIITGSINMASEIEGKIDVMSDETAAEKLLEQDRTRGSKRFWSGLYLTGNISAITVMAGAGWYWFAIYWLMTVLAGVYMVSEMRGAWKNKREELAKKNG